MVSRGNEEMKETSPPPGHVSRGIRSWESSPSGEGCRAALISRNISTFNLGQNARRACSHKMLRVKGNMLMRDCFRRQLKGLGRA